MALRALLSCSTSCPDADRALLRMRDANRRVGVRLFLESRPMTSVSGLGYGNRSSFCDFACHTPARALIKL